MAFDLNRLHEILGATTTQLRDGPMVVERRSGPLEVTEIFAMPHRDEVPDEGVEKIDCCLVTIGVDVEEAQEARDELVALLREYPNPEELASGPSYIALGATIGDQGAAFQLMALGKMLGLWDLITPATFGMEGAEAKHAAGCGYILITPPKWPTDAAA